MNITIDWGDMSGECERDNKDVYRGVHVADSSKVPLDSLTQQGRVLFSVSEYSFISFSELWIETNG